MPQRIIVIGGGAAGFFAALSAKAHAPGAEVLLLEKSDKLLAKVRVSGGGRCNVTHAQEEPRRLARNYPRGGAFLKKAFAHWGVKETVAWFGERGLVLKTERDGRMFPVTDRSDTVIDLLVGAAAQAGVEVRLRTPVARLERNGRWQVHSGDGMLEADRVIVASGGSPKREGLAWIERLGHAIVDPVPSLFTFNLPGDPLTALMGVVADPVRVRIEGSAQESVGPLLITHWGISGPAVLKLSAWAARELHAKGYVFNLAMDWLGERSEEQARADLLAEQKASPKRKLINSEVHGLPSRLWAHLLGKAGLDGDSLLGDLGKHDRNRLLALLTNDRHTARGKTTFKEEFVTAGGVDLAQVDPVTLESRVCPGLHFAGEVLDIDGVTGGFNFQAAWTTGWLAGKSAARP